jgi:hypothetical protein
MDHTTIHEVLLRAGADVGIAGWAHCPGLVRNEVQEEEEEEPNAKMNSFASRLCQVANISPWHIKALLDANSFHLDANIGANFSIRTCQNNLAHLIRGNFLTAAELKAASKKGLLDHLKVTVIMARVIAAQMALTLQREHAPGVDILSHSVQWTEQHANKLRSLISDLYSLEPPARNSNRILELVPGSYYMPWHDSKYTNKDKVHPEALAKVIGTYCPLTSSNTVEVNDKTKPWIDKLNTRMSWTQAVVTCHCLAVDNTDSKSSLSVPAAIGHLVFGQPGALKPSNAPSRMPPHAELKELLETTVGRSARTHTSVCRLCATKFISAVNDYTDNKYSVVYLSPRDICTVELGFATHERTECMGDPQYFTYRFNDPLTAAGYVESVGTNLNQGPIGHCLALSLRGRLVPISLRSLYTNFKSVLCSPPVQQFYALDHASVCTTHSSLSDATATVGAFLDKCIAHSEIPLPAKYWKKEQPGENPTTCPKGTPTCTKARHSVPEVLVPLFLALYPHILVVMLTHESYHIDFTAPNENKPQIWYMSGSNIRTYQFKTFELIKELFDNTPSLTDVCITINGDDGNHFNYGVINNLSTFDSSQVYRELQPTVLSTPPSQPLEPFKKEGDTHPPGVGIATLRKGKANKNLLYVSLGVGPNTCCLNVPPPLQVVSTTETDKLITPRTAHLHSVLQSGTHNTATIAVDTVLPLLHGYVDTIVDRIFNNEDFFRFAEGFLPRLLVDDDTAKKTFMTQMPNKHDTHGNVPFPLVAATIERVRKATRPSKLTGKLPPRTKAERYLDDNEQYHNSPTWWARLGTCWPTVSPLLKLTKYKYDIKMALITNIIVHMAQCNWDNPPTSQLSPSKITSCQLCGFHTLAKPTSVPQHQHGKQLHMIKGYQPPPRKFVPINGAVVTFPAPQSVIEILRPAQENKCRLDNDPQSPTHTTINMCTHCVDAAICASTAFRAALILLAPFMLKIVYPKSDDAEDKTRKTREHIHIPIDTHTTETTEYAGGISSFATEIAVNASGQLLSASGAGASHQLLSTAGAGSTFTPVDEQTLGSIDRVMITHILQQVRHAPTASRQLTTLVPHHTPTSNATNTCQIVAAAHALIYRAAHFSSIKAATILATSLFDKTVHVREYFASVARLISFELVDTLAFKPNATDLSDLTVLHLRLSADTDFATHVTILDPHTNKHSDLPLPLKPALTTLFLVPAKQATRIRHFPLSLRPLLLLAAQHKQPKQPKRLSFTVYADLAHGPPSKGTAMSLTRRDHNDTPLTVFLPTTTTTTTKRPPTSQPSKPSKRTKHC